MSGVGRLRGVGGAAALVGAIAIAVHGCVSVYNFEKTGGGHDDECVATGTDASLVADVADVALPDASSSSLSCAGGLSCGGISCCDSKSLPGGTFMQGRATAGPENDVCSTWTTSFPDCDEDNDQPEFSSTVSSFALDTYEVTVGRFRKFVEAYPGNQPAPGAGAHPKIAGSGWDASWTSSLPVDRAALIANIACDAFYATWTDAPAANESRPIDCVNWLTAFAFCAWDGGRLPTEAEWEYAASGGEDRVVPWEVPPAEAAPDVTHAIFDCLYGGTGTCTGIGNIADVGSVPLGVSRWGQQDMAGNVWEWTLDVYDTYSTAPLSNFANLAPGPYRVFRGGGFLYRAGGLRAARRAYSTPTTNSISFGLRCARDVP